MYFSTDEVRGLWQSSEDSDSMPVLIKKPFSTPIATEDEVLGILKQWADAARQGRATVADISQLDAGALPEAGDRTLSACIERIGRTWPGDWFAYVNDVHQYNGAVWERAVEILLPAIRKNGGLPAGGFRIEGFFGKYETTPTGIHLDSSDNFSFIVRGPKRLAFWPRDRFRPLVQMPDHRAPSQELALTRDYGKHIVDAIVIDGEVGDVVYWPKEYWHVGASPEGWTAMINLAMWWNARPITLARFVLDRVLDLDGEARLHPFNPDSVLADALTPPATIRQPIRDAASQISAHCESVGRVVWAGVATSYGFTTPPSKVAAPPLSDGTRIRVKHPIVPLAIGDGYLVMACGHRTRASVVGLYAACARLNATPGAEYEARELIDVLAGGDTDSEAREECTRVIGELISCRALEVVAV